MDYDALHNKNVNYYSRKIRQLYLDVINDIMKLSVHLSLNSNNEFYWRNYSEINNKVNKLILELNSNVYAATVEGINLDWQTAVDKNDAIVKAIYGKQLVNLPKGIKENYLSNNGTARRAFIQRKIKGLKLSDRVWKNTRQLKTDLELALEIGIGDGKSAAKLSQDVRTYLNDPDKLFRRVANKENGQLRLSKAYKTYAPGRGIYKSSYKNALRLTRNEINNSYRTSEYEKRQKQDFITGVRISVSPSHNPADDKGGISCISLQGDYSKDFKFEGWHVNCRCVSTNIIKTDEELDKDLDRLLSGDNPTATNRSENYVSGMPDNFRSYVNDNKKKWANYQSQPYFMEYYGK